MATTSYNSKIIVKEHTTGDFSGSYKLLIEPDNIPAPSSAPNTVEITNLLNDTQTFLRGIKTSDAKEVTGNLEKEYVAALKELKDKKLDVMHLYGSDGVGGVSKWAYQSDGVAYTVSEVGGNDEAVKMSATLTPCSDSKEVVDDYTVTDNGDGTYTVAKVGA